MMVSRDCRPMPEAAAPPTRLGDDDLSRLLLIRHFELTVQDLFAGGHLSGTTHTCTGQEYVPVALEALLRDGDYVFSNHRGHGHYLARFDDPEGLLAEMTGRDGALCAGVGGSQHVRRARFHSTGVQGQSLPVATGTALHLQRAGAGALACVYIGDGTWGEGAVYEAINLAALWWLPVLVAVEHNGIAQSTPTARQMAGTIAGRAAAFGLAHLRVDSRDVSVIRAQIAETVGDVRGGKPAVLEFRTDRLGPHSKGDDTRAAPERTAAEQRDWLPRYRESFPEQVARIDEVQRRRMAAVAADVLGRPLSRWQP
ncbi:thiamine pyrophosphate-dependent dehydrogenase E1 component subunit alpha [Actinoplanes sp. NPDC026619]|uniref:thiamine pyrophosphate-dependent dehydrogenase E1 component subunit alpha n=1 Tax=Actinoplanes sp. NPDC026619 TaxID=3155798 RepID=UPI0033DD76B7